jgi:heparin/heparan-sulfate lyase
VIAGALSGALAFAAPGQVDPALRWKVVDGVSIPVPPAEHPRLYLRARGLPDLQRRMGHPVMKPVWEKMQAAGQRYPQIAVETDAVRYLLNHDSALGRATVERTLKLLADAKFDLSIQDITRPIGRLLVTASVVYDWCYPVLTGEQKKALLAEMMKLARQLECGYPPPKAGWITGHYSEWMLLRDMLSAGLAVYDEFPEMYELAANRFFGGFLPVRNWWYPGGAFHQGTSYAETRFVSDLYPLWIFDRLGAGNVYNPAQQFVPYQWIYLRRPDGQLFRAGDGQGKTPKLRSLLVASYYGDSYILGDYMRNSGIDTYNLLFEFLWRDPDLKPRPASELPLSRYMASPYGWMVARSGWDDASAIAEMKVNIYNFANHQHLDAGSFQIWYKGALAIDSGLYEGTDGGYGSPHDYDYNKRTIAHNSLLVFDPAEAFTRGGKTYVNDGGQQPPNLWREAGTLELLQSKYKTGEVLGHGFGPDARKPLYTYLEGDLTQAYSGKVREVKRSFVFLNFAESASPAALVVFDRVVAAEAAFKKTWLLHSMEEPRIEGDSFTVTPHARAWTGKLVDTVVLPAHGNARLETIGGPGREFWVAGQNFPNRPKGGNPDEFETGGWRVELSPGKASAADLFLNVMQVMDREARPRAVEAVEGADVTGVRIADRVVLFRRESRRAEGRVTFATRGTTKLGYLVTDLAAGRWQVWRDGAMRIPAIAVSAEEGAASFTGPAGAYELRRTGQ